MNITEKAIDKALEEIEAMDAADAILIACYGPHPSGCGCETCKHRERNSGTPFSPRPGLFPHTRPWLVPSVPRPPITNFTGSPAFDPAAEAIGEIDDRNSARLALYRKEREDSIRTGRMLITALAASALFWSAVAWAWRSAH